MKRFVLALSVTVAVVSGLTVTSAFATGKGTVSLFTGGGGTATWVSTHGNNHSAVLLSLQSAGDYAGITLKHISATAPSVAPTFVTDNYAAGSPRLVMEFAGGGMLFGYPSQFSSQWEVAGTCVAAGSYTDYTSALAAVQADATCGGNVIAAYVVADGSGGTPEADTISSLVYDGATYIG